MAQPEPGKLKWPSLPAPTLTKSRILLAMSVAVVIDFVQIPLGPVGWLWFDEVLDVLGMILTSAAIGFHPLLLPTFLLEIIPMVDMLPTWTACTAAVIMLRKRSQARSWSPPPAPPVAPPPIDVQAEVTRVPPKL